MGLGGLGERDWFGGVLELDFLLVYAACELERYSSSSSLSSSLNVSTDILVEEDDFFFFNKLSLLVLDLLTAFAFASGFARCMRSKCSNLAYNSIVCAKKSAVFF